MLKKLLGVAAMALAIAGCDVSGLVPQEHQDFAKRVVTMVQANDEAGLKAVSLPALWEQLTPDLRARMAAIFPPNETATNVSISHWKSNWAGEVAIVELVMLYDFPSRDVHVEMSFQSAGNRQTLTRIYVQPVGGQTGSAPVQPAPPQSVPQSGEREMPPDSGEREMPPEEPQQEEYNDDKSTTL